MDAGFYLLAESLILIVIVALLGLSIGWVWRGISVEKMREEMEHLDEIQRRMQQKLSDTERHYNELDRLNAELRQSRHDLELQLASQAQEYQDFRDANTDIDYALARKDSEIADKIEQIDELETKLRAQLERVGQDGTRATYDDADSEIIDSLTAELKLRDKRLADNLVHIDELESKLGEAGGEHFSPTESTSSATAQLDAAKAEFEQKLSLRDAQIEALQSKLATQASEVSESGHPGEDLRNEVLSLHSTINERERKIAALEHKLVNSEDASNVRISELTEDLRRAEDEAFSKESQLVLLRQDLESIDRNSIESLQQQLEEKNEDISRLEGKLAAGVEQARASARADDEFRKELDTLQWSLAQKDNEIARLKRESAGSHAAGPANPVSDTKNSDFSLSDDLLKDLRSSNEILREMDEQIEGIKGPAPNADGVPDGPNGADSEDAIGLVYLEEPETVDDLAAIKGIAAVLSGKLNKLGIYTYRQIANWTDPQVDAVSERLEFKDRIQRDQWIPQARRLHEQKYGEKV